MTKPEIPLVKLGPRAVASFERAGLAMLHKRYPGRRFVIERREEASEDGDAA